MENFIEPYHVQFVHKMTTRQPLNEHYTIIDGRCVGSAVDLSEEHGMEDNLGVSSRYLTLFPNFIVGRYFPDQLGVYLNVPLGPNRMLQKRALYTTEGQSLSATDIKRLKGLWWEVHKEDHEMCERMQVLRRTDYPDGRFTNTFIGYGPEAEFPTLELTHNWDQGAVYDKGDGWGHICIETSDVYKACEDLAAQGANITRPAGPMKHGTRVIAFCEDPDGYKVELNETILNTPGT